MPAAPQSICQLSVQKIVAGQRVEEAAVNAGERRHWQEEAGYCASLFFCRVANHRAAPKSATCSCHRSSAAPGNNHQLVSNISETLAGDVGT